jgi:hypothetical protein
MSGSDDDRQTIADRLRSLTLPELVDVMRASSPFTTAKSGTD